MADLFASFMPNAKNSDILNMLLLNEGTAVCAKCHKPVKFKVQEDVFICPFCKTRQVSPFNNPSELNKYDN